MVYPITKFWFYPLSWIFIRKIKGIENIPSRRPFIMVANHQHLADPLFLIYPILKKLNKKIHFLATPTWWFLGEKICRQWGGCIPLFDSELAYKETKKCIKSGEIVGIFPEGHLNSKIRYPKTGAVRLTMETNAPILPIGLNSSYWPFSVRINIGKLIRPKKKLNVEKGTLKIMDEVYRLKRY